jgi:hypothetical protein
MSPMMRCMGNRWTSLFEANLSMTDHLTVDQVKQAENWERAIYDEAFQKELGLLPEAPKEKSNEK